MDPSTLSEKQKYEKIWADRRYRARSPGFELAKFFFSHVKVPLGGTITDFGCGTGRAALRFLGNRMEVQLVDITRSALDETILNLCALDHRMRFIEAPVWDLPSSVIPTDWIFCSDLFEHLPTEKIDSAFAQMASRTLQGGIFQIYLEDEPFGEIIHDKLHLTLKPRDWWVQKISQYWEIKEVSPEIEGHVRFIVIVGRPHESR